MMSVLLRLIRVRNLRAQEQLEKQLVELNLDLPAFVDTVDIALIAADTVDIASFISIFPINYIYTYQS